MSESCPLLAVRSSNFVRDVYNQLHFLYRKPIDKITGKLINAKCKQSVKQVKIKIQNKTGKIIILLKIQKNLPFFFFFEYKITGIKQIILSAIMQS